MRFSPRLIQIVRISLLTLAGAATAVAAGIVFENWRGARDWSDYKTSVAAQGRRVDFPLVRGHAASAETNFFQAPVIQQIMSAPADFRAADGYFAGMEFGPVLTAVSQSKYLWPDWAAIRRSFERSHLLTGGSGDAPGPREILAGMKPVAPLLDAVGQAARERPDAAVELRDLRSYPPLSQYWDVVRLLCFRARLELEVKDVERADADLEAALRIGTAMAETSCNLMQTLVAHAIYGMVGQGVCEGCKAHVWSEAQLTRFQRSLEPTNRLAELRESLLNQEWPGAMEAMEHAKEQKFFPVPFWMPHGWIEQNKIRLGRLVDLAASTIDPAENRVDSSRLSALQESETALMSFRSPYNYLIPQFRLRSMIDGAAKGANEAGGRYLAIGLERYRVAHGSYPERLSELDAALLPSMPHNVMTGEPTGYERTAAGGYRIKLGEAVITMP